MAVNAAAVTTSLVTASASKGPHVLRNQFILVRHGQSIANERNLVCSGSAGITDYGLTEKGRGQAQEAGRELKNLLGHCGCNGATGSDGVVTMDGEVVIVSSPFKRAMETAGEIAKILGYSPDAVKREQNLSERYFGFHDMSTGAHDRYKSVWAVDADPEDCHVGSEKWRRSQVNLRDHQFQSYGKSSSSSSSSSSSTTAAATTTTTATKKSLAAAVAAPVEAELPLAAAAAPPPLRSSPPIIPCQTPPPPHQVQQDSDLIEPVSHVCSRATRVVLELDKAYSGATILLVAHGDTLQILFTAFRGVPASSHRSLPHMQTSGIRLAGLLLWLE